MLFSVKERVQLLSMLPPTSGGILFVRIMRQFREALSFDETEAKMLGIQTSPDGRCTLRDDASYSKEIDCGAQVEAFIVATLKALDEGQILTEDQVSLFDRFVPNQLQSCAD